LLLVNTSAPEFSGVIRSEPYPFRSWGMGDRPVLPESRLQLAIEIKKKAATIASLYVIRFIVETLLLPVNGFNAYRPSLCN
ncbi:MAG: hypothetical protein LUQ21_02530, partial [Methanothrix sp.]|nr:hypothetical protein [Methanothrix sp.]